MKHKKIADDFEARHKALHVNGNECDVQVKEANPELKKVVEEIRNIMANGSNVEKFSKLLPILSKIKDLDLN